MKSGHPNNLTEKLYSGNFLSRAGKYLRKAGLAALLTATGRTRGHSYFIASILVGPLGYKDFYITSTHLVDI